MGRVLVARWADWPVAAAGWPPEVPAAVLDAGQVVAVTAAGREARVVTGMRKRDAQSRCPGLVLSEVDPAREARLWEPAVAAVEDMAPGLEVVAPGELALLTRGPSRYFGGDEPLARKVGEAIQAAVSLPGGDSVQVGVADTRFAATLAALAAGAGSRSAGGGWSRSEGAGPRSEGAGPRPAGGGVVVLAPGATRVWLADQPVQALGRRFADLTGLLVRLGLPTLGQFADLPAASVSARFGPEGMAALAMARGEDEMRFRPRSHPPELEVVAELDPPEERAEAVAFVAKTYGAEMEDRLSRLGLAATVVTIELETEHGERLARRWRVGGGFDAPAIAVRARWQLDGWQGGASPPTSGVTCLRLVPEETHEGRQLELLTGNRPRIDVERAVARVQSLAGPDSVLVTAPAGGRGFADQILLLPWGSPPPAAKAAPWPGRLSHPSPVVVYDPPLPAELRDAGGRPVEVSARGVLSASPAFLARRVPEPVPAKPGRGGAGRGEAVLGGAVPGEAVLGGAVPGEAIVAWAGPWPVEERWWEEGGRRRARVQVLLNGGEAHLVYREAGAWWVEASYG